MHERDAHIGHHGPAHQAPGHRGTGPHRATDYDVVVVGGRVAGASTALLLARAGLRVALLDRGRHGSDTVSTHGLMRAGVLQLARMRVLDEVVAAGTPPVRRTLFHYAGLSGDAGDTVQVSIRPSPGVEALYAPRRQVLDRLLVDAAAAAGAVVHHEVSVTGLLRDGSGRVVGVRGRGRDGREATLRATWTVGADGIRSVVAEQAAAPVVRRGSAASAVLYRYHADLPTAGYEWAYGDGAAAGLIPTNDDLTCVFVATTPQRMREARRAGTEEAFEALLGRAAPELVPRVRQAPGAGRLHGWGGVPGFVRRPWGRGWALVGDAGYFKDPISTHGMTDALRDAELLADALVEVLGGLERESTALGRYQGLRDTLSTRVLEATDAVAGYDWDQPAIMRLLRELSSAMTDEVELLQSRGGWPGTAGVPRFVSADSRASSG